ncbi:MAG: hypothetical protein ACRDN1_22445 [Trebonia sp.]
MQYLSNSSTAGVLLDLSGAVMLLLAFACLASKLFNRYVVYYGAQSVVLAFAAGTSAAAFHSTELWILAALTLAIKGIAIPVAARRILVARLALKRDAAHLPGALLAIPVLLGKLALCGLAIVIIDTSFAKLRFFRIAEFLGAAFMLALVGVATSYVIGA